MRNFVVIAFILTALVSCIKKAAAPNLATIQPRPEDVATLEKLLGEASAAQAALADENRGSRSRAAQAANEVFAEFWNPKHLKRYGKHERDRELYANAKYLLVQPELVIKTRRDGTWSLEEIKGEYRWNRKDEDWDTETIREFSPVIAVSEAKVLWLTPSLSKKLEEFLGEEFSEATTPDVMSPSYAKGTSEERLAATRTMLQIYAKHWGNGWHLASHPEVEQILFDRNYQHALIMFRIVYQGGFAVYDKTSEGWRMTDSKMTWIE